MKTKTFIFIAALFAATALYAQNQRISVVAPGGATALYTTLDDAITNADAGSTLYLSGGGFPIKAETKITKKLTLIGVGHRADNDNADGNTIVSGNICFEGGADNSALMGVHLNGDVKIGAGDVAVNNILVRYCNINSILVANSNCQGVVINQNYIRGDSYGGYSPVTFSNNILDQLGEITGGTIIHNVAYNLTFSSSSISRHIKDSYIVNNITMSTCYYCSGGTISNNMSLAAFGDNAIAGVSWDDMFVGPNNGVSTTSNFALKSSSPGKGAAIDGSDVGIYGGTGFSNDALPPGPRIVSKKVSETTDASGNLKVEITVSAK